MNVFTRVSILNYTYTTTLRLSKKSAAGRKKNMTNGKKKKKPLNIYFIMAYVLLLFSLIPRK